MLPVTIYQQQQLYLHLHYIKITSKLLGRGKGSQCHIEQLRGNHFANYSQHTRVYNGSRILGHEPSIWSFNKDKVKTTIPLRNIIEETSLKFSPWTTHINSRMILELNYYWTSRIKRCAFVDGQHIKNNCIFFYSYPDDWPSKLLG